MIRRLKAAAMALTLVPISLGVSILIDAFTPAHAAQRKNLVVGTALCSLALTLFYSLGTRDDPGSR